MDFKKLEDNEQEEFKKLMFLYWTEIEKNTTFSPEMLDGYYKMIRSQHFRYIWWGIENNKKIGIINFLIISKYPNADKNKGFISEIYVYPEYRKNGFGTALVEEVIKFMKTKSVDEIELKVLFDNETALSFWKSFGFEVHKFIFKKTLI